MKVFLMLCATTLVIGKVYGELTTASQIIDNPSEPNVTKKIGSPRGFRIHTKASSRGGRMDIGGSDNFTDSETVSIELHSIRAYGRPPRGRGGKQDDDSLDELEGSRNGFGSFRDQSFAFSPLVENDTYPDTNLSASSLSFSTEMRKLINGTEVLMGRVNLTVYVFKESGAINVDGEVSDIFLGSVKVNLLVENFQFCSNATNATLAGCNNTRAEGLDVILAVSGKGGKKPEKASRRNKGDMPVYGLGGTAAIRMSQKVRIDNVWEDMDDDFPKMETRGPLTLFVCRLRKFTTEAFYDPTLDLELNDLEGGDDDNDGPDGPDDPTGSAVSVRINVVLAFCATIIKMMM